MEEEILKIKESFKKKLESYELDEKCGQLSVDSIEHLFPTEIQTILNYIELLEERIESTIGKIDLLLEDLKKDIQHKNETNQHWFNEELLSIRINEMKKLLKGDKDE